MCKCKKNITIQMISINTYSALYSDNVASVPVITCDLNHVNGNHPSPFTNNIIICVTCKTFK